MDKALYDRILQDITDRTSWDDRQRLWYLMRHDGIPRSNLPWPNAASLHFPLADTIIEKLKPFYAAQIYSSEVFARFVSLNPQYEIHAESASHWFDYQLRQRSNFEPSFLLATDHMLMAGRSVLKVYWDESKKRLCFVAVEPTRLIVPAHTRELQDADYVVHVITMTRDQVKRDSRYTLPETPEETGGTHDNDRTLDDRHRREGLTVTRNEQEVLFWEVYTKTADGKVRVETMQPGKPEVEVRKPFTLTHDGGYPFVSFATEIKEAGYYSARGIPEIVMSFELSISKTWCDKHDAMTLTTAPVYYSKGALPNGAQIRMRPGQILPFEIAPVNQPGPPLALDQEIAFLRGVAEYRVSMPDFGLTEQANPARAQRRDSRTAKEIESIGALSGMSSDLRARVCRLSLSELYRLAWCILVANAKGELDYLFDGALKRADANLFVGKYQIEPSGSADGWNREAQIRKAASRQQLLAGNPFIRQDELTKTVLEADDPKLVRRLFVDPGQSKAEQVEDQAQEIAILLLGFPAAVEPQDDDIAHIRTCVQFLQQRNALGVPVDQVAQQAIMQHMARHLMQLNGKDPKAGRAVREELDAMLAPKAQAQPQEAPVE